MDTFLDTPNSRSVMAMPGPSPIENAVLHRSTTCSSPTEKEAIAEEIVVEEMEAWQARE